MVVATVLKVAKASAHITEVLDHKKHKHIYHAYYCTAIVVYLAHIALSLSHGLEIDSTVQAAAIAVELIAHIAG